MFWSNDKRLHWFCRTASLWPGEVPQGRYGTNMLRITLAAAGITLSTSRILTFAFCAGINNPGKTSYEFLTWLIQATYKSRSWWSITKEKSKKNQPASCGFCINSISSLSTFQRVSAETWKWGTTLCRRTWMLRYNQKEIM